MTAGGGRPQSQGRFPWSAATGVMGIVSGRRSGRAAAVALAVGLGGCAPYVVSNPASPYSVVPVGSVLVLHQDVTIPPGHARAYFQRGKLVTSTNEYVPQCQLEVRDVRQAPQTVRAGRFVVSRLSQDVRAVADSGDFRLVRVRSGDDSGGPSMEMVAWKLWLQSRTQPNVMWLLCGGAFDDPYRAKPPGVDDIRNALGKIATIEMHR